jgi:hypothetical protein
MENKRAYEKPRIEALGSVEEMTQASLPATGFDGFYLTPSGDTTTEQEAGNVVLGSI